MITTNKTESTTFCVATLDITMLAIGKSRKGKLRKVVSNLGF